jgi:GntR family transcriptional regulator of arabinose operon
MKDLTSIPHPKEALGRRTAENLLRMIEDPSFDANYLFDAEPILRGSVKQMQ